MRVLLALLAGGLGAVLVAVMAYRWRFTTAWLRRTGLPSAAAMTDSAATRDSAAGEGDPPTRFAVLVPAHDEELLVEAAVHSALSGTGFGGRVDVYVIADRCQDRTAGVARSAGATVWEREEPEPPGKGPALAWGLARLDLDAYDAVAVVDADNLVDPDFFPVMRRHLAGGERILQGYDGLSNPDETMLTRLIAITSVMKNQFFYGGKSACGLSTLLMGTGMVFASAVLRERTWQAQSIGEDLEQGLELLGAGERIRFVPEAKVYAQEASSFRQGTAQRQRWSSGRQQLRGRAWSALREGLARRQPDLAHAGAELLLPTYAMTLNLTGLAGVLAWLAAPVSLVPAALVAVALLAQGFEVLLALRAMRASREFVTSLLLTPVFLVWRGIIDVLALFGFRRDRWTRTGRHAHDDDARRGESP